MKIYRYILDILSKKDIDTTCITCITDIDKFYWDNVSFSPNFQSDWFKLW